MVANLFPILSKCSPQAKKKIHLDQRQVVTVMTIPSTLLISSNDIVSFVCLKFNRFNFLIDI